MSSHMRSKKFDPEEDTTADFAQEFKICGRCKQEYTGSCPITSASCPMETAEKSPDDEEEDEEKDFDDVDHLGNILKKDEEADALTEESDEIPEGDLSDD